MKVLNFGETRPRAGRQYQVAGEAFVMQFVSVSGRVREFSNQHFRLCVLALMADMFLLLSSLEWTSAIWQRYTNEKGSRSS